MDGKTLKMADDTSNHGNSLSITGLMKAAVEDKTGDNDTTGAEDGVDSEDDGSMASSCTLLMGASDEQDHDIHDTDFTDAIAQIKQELPDFNEYSESPVEDHDTDDPPWPMILKRIPDSSTIAANNSKQTTSALKGKRGVIGTLRSPTASIKQEVTYSDEDYDEDEADASDDQDEIYEPKASHSRHRKPAPRSKPKEKTSTPVKREDGKRLYACDREGCDKSYDLYRTLTRHIICKHEEWKFSCTFDNCEMKFPLETLLKKHLKRHSAEKPFTYVAGKRGVIGASRSSTSGMKQEVPGIDGEDGDEVDSSDNQDGDYDPKDSSSQRRKSAFKPKPRDVEEADTQSYICDKVGCGKSYSCHRTLRRHILCKHEEWKFFCTFEDCKLKFPLENLLKKHVKRHSDERPFPCEKPFCPVSFKTGTEMRRHMKVHDEVRPFPCVIEGCELAFKQPKAVDTHIERAHGGHVFKCQNCDKQYPKYVQLRKHEEIHVEERQFVCEKDGCGKTFTTAYYLKTHDWKCHRAKKRWACQVCGKMFKCISQVSKHEKKHLKPEEREHECAECGKRFATPDTLRKHVRIHCEDSSFLCPNCGVSFKQEDTMNRHLKKCGHIGEESQLCPLCGKTCKSGFYLKMHIEVAHERGEESDTASTDAEKLFVCKEPECGKSFRLAKYLKEHEQFVHCGESHTCSLCSKSFSCFRYLKNHWQTHSEERNYQCPDCGKAFKTNKEMTRHQEIHTEIRRHHCPKPNCGRAYKTASTLRIHLKIHAKNERRNEMGMRRRGRPIKLTRPADDLGNVPRTLNRDVYSPGQLSTPQHVDNSQSGSEHNDSYQLPYEAPPPNIAPMDSSQTEQYPSVMPHPALYPPPFSVPPVPPTQYNMSNDMLYSTKMAEYFNIQSSHFPRNHPQ